MLHVHFKQFFTHHEFKMQNFKSHHTMFFCKIHWVELRNKLKQTSARQAAIYVDGCGRVAIQLEMSLVLILSKIKKATQETSLPNFILKLR